MGMSGGGRKWRLQLRNQRHADGRHHARAADHLHGGHAISAAWHHSSLPKNTLTIPMKIHESSKTSSVVISIPEQRRVLPWQESSCRRKIFKNKVEPMLEKIKNGRGSDRLHQERRQC